MKRLPEEIIEIDKSQVSKIVITRPLSPSQYTKLIGILEHGKFGVGEDTGSFDAKDNFVCDALVPTVSGSVVKIRFVFPFDEDAVELSYVPSTVDPMARKHVDKLVGRSSGVHLKTWRKPRGSRPSSLRGRFT